MASISRKMIRYDYTYKLKKHRQKATKKNTVIEYTQMIHGGWYYYKYNKYRRWLRMVYINLEIIL